MRPLPAILILAAGASSRMRGRDKLLEEIDGTPLILRAVRAACSTVPEVLVTLPEGDRSRRAWLGDTHAQLVDVTDHSMSGSIRAGVAACTGSALLIHLADMPEINAHDLATLATAWTETDTPILRATAADGTPGQPVIFDRSLFPDLAALTGDIGAKHLLSRHELSYQALPHRHALVDLDTPEAWSDWRARRG
ncbi:MAG: nucleotidyltransferase family protein [Jannaschia sp.]